MALGRNVGVVRSVETRTVQRKLTGNKKEEISDWMWVTTLSQEKAGAEAIIELGHDRWLIENKAINEPYKRRGIKHHQS